MDKDKRIKELEDKIAMYEGMPHAEFYTALMEGMKHITTEIKNKTLNFDNDPFAKNVFLLAKDADKVMATMEKGAALFVQKEEKAVSKKQEKSNTEAI